MIWLDNARIIAMFAVVWLHVDYGLVMTGQIGSEDWWVGNIYQSMGRWCVPVFVMISGVLLLDPSKEDSIPEFYKKRASRVLMPLIVWTIVYLIWNYLLKHMTHDEPLVLQFAKKVFYGHPYYHLWFLYMLAGLYLFTPFLRKIISYSSRRELVLLVVTTFIISAINSLIDGNERTFFINTSLTFIPFYCAGYLLKTSRAEYSTPALFFVVVFSIALTALGCFFLGEHYGMTVGLYFYRYLGVTVIPTSIAVMLLLKKLQSPLFDEAVTKKISAMTMGVYLLHPIILDVLGQLGLHPAINHALNPVVAGFLKRLGLGHVSINPIVSVPMVTMFTFALSLFCVMLINRTTYLKKLV